MKKLFLFFIISLFFISTSKAVDLDASISYATFKAPDQSYVEIYLHLVGKTIAFTTSDSLNYQAKVEVLILFKQNGEIVKFDKYNLNSPLSKRLNDFIDIKRYGLENGEYDLEVSINDLNKENNTRVFNAKLNVNYEGEQLLQSDIQLLSSFTSDRSDNPFVKNGYYLEPLPFNFYYRTHTKLTFYNEVYNADKAIADDFMIRYTIEKIDNGRSRTIALGHKKRKAESTNVFLLQMDISNLPSGNYKLLIEVRNRENQLLSSKSIPFQRSNPLLNASSDIIAAVNLNNEFVGDLTAEELVYSLKAIAPKVPDGDIEFLNRVIKTSDLEQQRRFLFNFWVSENHSNPRIAFSQYMEVAKAVDLMYRSGFGFGFETDRGYYYLKYGRPDNYVSVESEPSAPPYEMWIYYTFPSSSQKNVKFIFYNPSLVANDYKLLHSTARGEISNPRWEIDLYNSDTSRLGNTDFDSTTLGEGFDRNARRYFEDL